MKFDALVQRFHARFDLQPDQAGIEEIDQNFCYFYCIYRAQRQLYSGDYWRHAHFALNGADYGVR